MVDGYNKQNMKRFINIISILAAVVIAGSSCSTEKETPLKSVNQELTGDWHLSETTVEGTTLSNDVDVYLRIWADGKFELYQKSTGQMRYDVYSGKCWSESGNILAGKCVHFHRISGICYHSGPGLPDLRCWISEHGLPLFAGGLSGTGS
jgi:hypothetical protein